MRLLLRSGDHSILRTPAPSCTLLPPTKQVEVRVFAFASRGDPRRGPSGPCLLYPPKATCAVHQPMSAVVPKTTAKADIEPLFKMKLFGALSDKINSIFSASDRWLPLPIAENQCLFDETNYSVRKKSI